MISDTPISDSTPHNVADLGMLCRQLERELNAANQRIHRLEKAGDEVVMNWFETHRDIHQLDDKGINKVTDRIFEYEKYRK